MIIITSFKFIYLYKKSSLKYFGSTCFTFVSITCDYFQVRSCLQGGREISAIIVTDDYLCYEEPKIPLNFFLILIFNELFKFETSDEWQR